MDWPTSRLGRKSGDQSPHSRTLPRRLDTSLDGLTDNWGRHCYDNTRLQGATQNPTSANNEQFLMGQIQISF